MKEKKAIGFKSVDSSIWIAYLTKNLYGEIIDMKETFVLSSLVIFEVWNKLLKDGVDEEKINESIQFIKQKSIIIPVSTKIAEKAAVVAFEKKVPALDSLIYATTLLQNSKLITLDNDFRGLENAEVLNV